MKTEYTAIRVDPTLQRAIKQLALREELSPNLGDGRGQAAAV